VVADAAALGVSLIGAAGPEKAEKSDVLVELVGNEGTDFAEWLVAEKPLWSIEDFIGDMTELGGRVERPDVIVLLRSAEGNA